MRDLKTFARHMRDQRGWDIATTAAWETSSPTSDAHARPTYTFRIRRRSLA